MVLTSCWRCARQIPLRALLRPARQTNPPATTPTILLRPKQQQSSSFSTTLQKAALVKKKTTLPMSNPKAKGSTTLKIKKKGPPVKVSKPAEVGVRRAERKRLVLANANALEVELPTLTAEIAKEDRADGAVFRFEGAMIDTLRTLEGFQLKQGWEFFHTPSTLVKGESVELGKLMAWVNGEDLARESRSGRRIITGPRGVGKSVLLTQAMAWAHQRNWVVLTIPNAQDLVIGHTEYEHDLSTGLWLQKPYTMALLQRFLKASATVLKATPLSQNHVFGGDVIPKTDSLYKLTELGSLDVWLSWDVLNAVLYELSLPGRPPVLFTLDNLNYISLPSAYRSPDFTPIHAHDLALPNLFLSYLRGERTFWRGLTLASTTARSPATPALTFALAGEEVSPYKKLDPRVAPSIKGAPVMAVSPLTRPQAKALMEYYRDSGLYSQDVQSTLAEKWVLSSGIPKELMKACLRLKY
ncbi:mitochondrial ribosomal death-associated protein 3-domain-containing protein [Terfezia claveryi]|nr:mitochondrial ribosomal death-associated protein 3-domain-containing protein [Terfezia claveryi]